MKTKLDELLTAALDELAHARIAMLGIHCAARTLEATQFEVCLAAFDSHMKSSQDALRAAAELLSPDSPETTQGSHVGGQPT